MGDGKEVRALLATRDRVVLACVLAAYALVGLVLLPSYDAQLDLDLVAYVELAERWAAFELGDAISGHWSPLWSWLLVPFLWAGVEPLLAAKVIGLFGGALLVVLVWIWCRRWDLHPLATAATTGVAALLGLAWALPNQSGPDVLVPSAVLGYLLLRCEPSPSRRRVVATGVVIALGYFTKAYLLPFFVGHLVITTTLEARRTPRAGRVPLVRSTGLVLAVAAAVCLPWVVALSAELGQPTFSTAGTYNVRKLAPDSGGHPIFSQLVPPDRADSSTAWVALDQHEVPPYRPWADADDLRSYVDQLAFNVEDLQTLVVDLSVFAPALLAVSALWWLGGRAEPRAAVESLLVAGAVYLGGYLLVLVEDRYLWTLWVVVVLLAAHLSSCALRSSWRQAIVSVGVALWVVSVCFGPASMLLRERGLGEDLRADAMARAPHVPDDARVAAVGGGGVVLAAQWCWYWHVQCYGAVDPDLDDEEVEQLLDRSGITHVVVPARVADDPTVAREVPLDSWSGFVVDPELSDDHVSILVRADL